MEAKAIEVLELLCACHEKSDIAEILNINRMTVIKLQNVLKTLNHFRIVLDQVGLW